MLSDEVGPGRLFREGKGEKDCLMGSQKHSNSVFFLNKMCSLVFSCGVFTKTNVKVT